jgi:hypothetical protein
MRKHLVRPRVPDDQLQDALRLPTNQPSQNISIKLLTDCVMR